MQSYSILNIDNSSFSNNISLGGGAITTLWKPTQKTASLVVKNSTFTGNSALSTEGEAASGKGGAIYNAGSHFTMAGASEKENEINNSTFINNTAAVDGGAIANISSANQTAELNFTGNNVFSGNKANGVLNDIHNIGIINVKSGTLTLDGGITGDGTLNMANGTTLSAIAGTTAISNKVFIDGDATLNLIVSDATTTDYTLVSGTLNKEFKIVDNVLFDIKSTANGTYSITKKSAEEVVGALETSENQSSVLNAMMTGTNSKAMTNVLTALQSSDAKVQNQAKKALVAIAPDAAPKVSQQATQTTTQLFNIADNRMTNIQSGPKSVVPASTMYGSSDYGMSSGDTPATKSAFWAQGLYNYASLDDRGTTKGFDSNTFGFAMGTELITTSDAVFGLGYSYSRTNIDGYLRETDVDNMTLMAYGQYSFDRTFINATLSLGMADYEETKNVLGMDVDANFSAYNFAAQIKTGYNLAYNGIGITPEFGMRYITTKQDKYTDGAGQSVDSSTTNMLTGIVGVRFNSEFGIDRDWSFVPELKLGASYDINNNNATIVRLQNGAAYAINGETLKALNGTIGVTLGFEYGDSMELGLTYEANIRQYYQDHTGMLSFKYKF